ncbi:hypothetical protein DL762_009810 [Monosporascus cannonballus]|uniref:Cell wall protein PhiA n=1 Tax=Monosporascus cannonballus TaxID=155416 RepID=A0ABY0GWZ8_9PEZI|nr:hypothetical protein DL762_009810 [Monosporascus cannonballus]RYO77029.1 hypothetical protein DL763_010089 [Monosporascus cannonballus]
MALRSASPVHFASISASQSNLFLHLPKQGASCDVEDPGYATFSLIDGGLFLYAASATPQQIYVDRSGMGQGKLGYITGAQPPPRNAEMDGWVVDESGNLSLDGAGFLACPDSIEGSWSLWIGAGVAQPGGNSGCLGISARVVEAAKPISCYYTA